MDEVQPHRTGWGHKTGGSRATRGFPAEGPWSGESVRRALQSANARFKSCSATYWVSAKASQSLGVPPREMGIIAAAVRSW